MIQYTVLVVTILLMLVIAAAFAVVAFNGARPAVDYSGVQAKSFSLRAKVFWTLIVASVLITVITTLDLPYAATRGDTPADAVTIDIEGRQWLWLMSDAEVEVGDTVVFNVSSFDVNHGLGVYDPDMRMIGQTQAMPGYLNSLEVTFDRPGIYSLLCMEYCGLSHHVMLSLLTVGEAGAAADEGAAAGDTTAGENAAGGDMADEGAADEGAAGEGADEGAAGESAAGDDAAGEDDAGEDTADAAANQGE